MMAIGVARFYFKGWIYDLYVSPQYHFTYYGFDWVKPLSETGMYTVFALMFCAAIFITLGFLYRISAITFFLLFTYVELIDKTTYLNHYYFVSLVAFLLIFLPANRRFSLDANLLKRGHINSVPAWTINILKFQLFIVYFYAGVAKLNADWMIHALPLKIWLPASSHLPVIGSLLTYEWAAYIFSWGGAIYDLTIVFFLLNSRTRGLAFISVVIFHSLTAVLFPIGMFPYIMTLSVLIFFSSSFHENILRIAERLLKAKPLFPSEGRFRLGKTFSIILILNAMIQVIFPLRFALYPGNLFWHEQGYRFSWRVMLMEKMGNTSFKVTDPQSHNTAFVANYEYLTPLQEKQMSTQPDMILQFAQHLKEDFEAKGIKNPIVTVDCKVTLNGRKSRLFIDKNINLADQSEGWNHKSWILPFDTEYLSTLD
ncbi:MAG: HTTM domain-containing protein [Cyclobacteriaceae bacterium]